MYVINEKDFEYSVQIIRWFLKPIGAWPLATTASKREKAVSDVIIFICSTLLIGLLIPAGLATFLEQNDTKAKLKAIGPISFWVMAVIKYAFLLLHTDDIRLCIRHVEIDWLHLKKENDRKILLKNAKLGRYVSWFAMIFMQTGILFYDMINGLSTVVIFVGNDSVTLHMVPFPFYNRIIQSGVSPGYELVFVFQCLSTFAVNAITAGACTLAAVFVMHACGQLTILMSLLENLIDKEERRTAVGEIVEHHLRILSFISRIEQVLHQICLVELIGCTLNICLLGYYFITEWQQRETNSVIAYLIIFISRIFNIFIFCFIGELLSEQCRRVGQTAYLTEWYRLPKESALAFILIILRSQSIIKITAGKLIQLSFVTFGDVIRTAMAYLNVLWAMVS